MYGPPGSGKTPSAIALAEKFKLSIYVLTMTDNALDDQALEFLFNCLEYRCIVLLEDVDCAGLGIGLTKKSVNYIDRDGTTQTKDVLKGLTLNGLLNVIDGPASRDGRVLLLTTNGPNPHGKALIRAGRCDERILFGYACAEVSSQLFRQIFALTEDEIQRGVTDTFAHLDITELASQFPELTPPSGASRDQYLPALPPQGPSCCSRWSSSIFRPRC